MPESLPAPRAPTPPGLAGRTRGPLEYKSQPSQDLPGTPASNVSPYLSPLAQAHTFAPASIPPTSTLSSSRSEGLCHPLELEGWTAALALLFAG